MRIGELALRAGVTASRLRFYEQSGLLPPAERSGNGYRTYGERDLKIIAFIERAQRLGFPLKTIGAFLKTPPGQRSATLLSSLEVKLVEIDEHIRDVRQRRSGLAKLIAELRSEDPSRRGETRPDSIQIASLLCQVGRKSGDGQTDPTGLQLSSDRGGPLRELTFRRGRCQNSLMGGARRGLSIWFALALAWAGALHAAEAVKPKMVLQADHGTSPTAIAWTPDNRYLLTGGADHHVLIWDRASGHIIDNLTIPLDFDGLDLCWIPGHYAINKIAVSPDGKYVFADVRWGNRYGAQAEQRVAIFDMTTRRMVALEPVEGIAWFPDSRKILVREPARWSLDVSGASASELRTEGCENRSKPPATLSAGVARAYDIASASTGPPIADGLPDNAPLRLSADGRFLVSLRSIDLDARLASGCRDVREPEDCQTPGHPREPTDGHIAAERDTLVISRLDGAAPTRRLTPDGTQILGTQIGADGRMVYVMTRGGGIFRYGVRPVDDLPPIRLDAWPGRADQGPWLSADGRGLLFQMKRLDDETRKSADGEAVQGANGNYVVLVDARAGVERRRSPGQTLGVDGGQAVIFQGFDDDRRHRWPTVRLDLATGETTEIGAQFHVPSAYSSDGKSVALIREVDPRTGVAAPEDGAAGLLQIVDFADATKPQVLSGVISTFAVDARVSESGAWVWANHLKVKQSYLNYLKSIDDGRDLPVETLAFNLAEGRFEVVKDGEARLKTHYVYASSVASEPSPDGRFTVRYLNSTSVVKVTDKRRPETPVWLVKGLTGSVLRVGFLNTRPVMWIATTDGAIGFWSTVDCHEILKLYLLPGRHFFAVAPDGRYDSDLGPDAQDLRWLMSDQPFQSLAPQTFMRQFYQPKLIGLVFSCLGRETTETCEKRFPPVPDLASLNRVLPETRIVSVAPTPDGREADVAVDAKAAIDATPVQERTARRAGARQDPAHGRFGGRLARQQRAGGSTGRERLDPGAVHRRLADHRCGGSRAVQRLRLQRRSREGRNSLAERAGWVPGASAATRLCRGHRRGRERRSRLAAPFRGCRRPGHRRRAGLDPRSRRHLAGADQHARPRAGHARQYP
jgi:DNA-binding transcriptional MerR regulator